MIRHCLLAITMLSPSLSPFLSLAITYLSVARVKQFEFRTPSCISQILFAHRDTASDAVTAIARTQITEFGTEHRPRKKKTRSIGERWKCANYWRAFFASKRKARRFLLLDGQRECIRRDGTDSLFSLGLAFNLWHVPDNAQPPTEKFENQANLNARKSKWKKLEKW